MIKKYLNTLQLTFVSLVFFAFGLASMQAQIVKDFEPRESAKAPAPYKNVKNYNLQGDFTMIGNTNLELFIYGDNKNNNAWMNFVDIDGDNSTRNSSSAELVIPGGECTEIVYAGLYWSGRAHNVGSSPMTFNGFDKREVKLKNGNDAYQTVTAATDDIHYPSSDNGKMYAAYADVTEYVRNHGAGNYFVADMALTEGNGGGTGYYGGWGMVVIYKNTAMKWRDITVFDGYGYMTGGTTGSSELFVSGFKAAQSGPINIRMGMMAGEGDVGISGDYFEIKRRANNTYDRLSHDGNATNNFFNSSIYTLDENGNQTPRNPSRRNNTGMDVSMFDLPNTNHRYIGNSDTSTRFRYGSTQDTYIIFNITFAVDAYVPEVVGENSGVGVDNTSPPANGGSISPAQELAFELDIYNKGEEAVNNTKIEIPVPFNLHFDGATITSNLPSGGTVSWSHPHSSDPAVTPGGLITWDIGDLPYDPTKEELLAQLKYSFRVSDNCILLSTTSGSCGLEVNINGTITGTGATSGTGVLSDLVRDYGDDICGGPVYDDFTSLIDIEDSFIQSCSPPVENGIMQFKAFCELDNDVFTRAEVEAVYPLGTKFFSQEPASYDSTTDLITGDFPVSTISGEKTLYYAVAPGMKDGCHLLFETSLISVDTEPTVNDVAFCQGVDVVLDVTLSDYGNTHGHGLIYYDENDAVLAEEPAPTEVGVHAYKVAEILTQDGVDCIGPIKEFTVTIHKIPEVADDIENVLVCVNNDVTFSIPAETGANYTWEYTTDGTNWSILNNTTLPGTVSVSETTLTMSHATMSVNGTTVRLKVDKDGCEAYSNEIDIEVVHCRGMINPSLPGQSPEN